MTEDFYDVLGVGRQSDAKALKSAYRKKVMQYHPDRNQGDAVAEEKFKSVSRAYEILSDPEKRAAYDRFGHSAFAANGGGASNSGFGMRSAEDIFSDVFGDAFSEFFGTGTRRSAERGDDLRHDCTLDLEDAFHGKSLTVSFQGKKTCATCSGSGAESEADISTCQMCRGTGRVRTQQGFFTMERACPTCRGKGKTLSRHCPVCHGRATVSAERSVKVAIPAGIEHGQRIRLEGKGDPSEHGGPDGDLYIFVSIREHDIFERDGTDLYTRASIPMVQAALGGEVEIPTVEGSRERVKIPAGTQTGKRRRLAGKGMPSLRGGRGDLHVELAVETPQALSARQKELLREFAEKSSATSHPESEGFLSRVKTFFERNVGASNQN